MAEARARYRTILQDSARWDEIRLRDGDIVISTPAKSGTTWTQMICALLIFQTPELPRRLDDMSVWLDLLTNRIEDIVAELESQRHRRFMKTHTPLDGLPFDERVTYICVARDPRDAAISWDHHMANADFDKIMAMRAAAVGMDDLDSTGGGLPEPLESARDRFWAWVDTENDAVVGLAAMFHHLSSFWRVRDRANVVLLHYDDLQADLDGQMRALAGRLGIDVDEAVWPELVRAATFDQMRRRAPQLVPEPEFWRDQDRFFRSGVTGQWRALLDDEDLRRYWARVEQLAEPELAAWVHRAAG